MRSLFSSKLLFFISLPKIGSGYKMVLECYFSIQSIHPSSITANPAHRVAEELKLV